MSNNETGKPVSIFKRFATDESKEKNGLWVSYDEGMEFLLRRAGSGNPLYRRAADFHLGPYRRRLANGTMDDNKSRELMAKVYADAIIADWKGVYDDDGKEMACTKENVVRVLTGLKDLFDNIQRDASEIDHFRLREVAEEAKN